MARKRKRKERSESGKKENSRSTPDPIGENAHSCDNGGSKSAGKRNPYAALPIEVVQAAGSNRLNPYDRLDAAERMGRFVGVLARIHDRVFGGMK